MTRATRKAAHRYTLVNGKVNGWLSVNDRGLAYGDGLFETVRVNQLKPVLWQRHLARLQRGCTALGLPFDPERLNADLQALLSLPHVIKMATGIAKIILTRGEGGRGYSPGASNQSNLILSWHPLAQPFKRPPKTGVHLGLASSQLATYPQLAGIKHLNRLEQVLAAQELAARDEDDLILGSTDGAAISAVSANLFLWRGDTLITPDLASAGVAGTMRQEVLEVIAPQLDIACLCETIALEQLATFDQGFICNSVFGFKPIASLAGKPWQLGDTQARLGAAIMDVVSA